MTGRCCTRDDTRSSPLADYLREIRDHVLLSADEEVALAEAVRGGDEDALARLIQANLRLVIRIARDFEGRGLPLEDLVGEGNLGLIRAGREFDPRFGVRFSTYASYWIKQAIRHALITTTAPIRLPAHMVALLTRWRRAERAYLRQFGRPASFELVAVSLGLTESKCRMVRQALLACRLLPGGGDPDDRDALIEVADGREAPEARLERDEQRRELRRRLARLGERERAIVAHRFGLDGHDKLTLKEIGLRLGVTREWVRKIEVRAIRKLGDDWAPPEPVRVQRRHAPSARTARLPALQSA